MNKNFIIAMAALMPLFSACTNDEPNPEPETEVTVPGEGETPDYDLTKIPKFSYEIKAYDGTVATDAVAYPVGNPDLNPNETEWLQTVTVSYNGPTATVSGAQAAGVVATVNGADVDLALNSAKQIRIVATGSSDCGSLRLTGQYKHLLELDNLTLSSTDRPAINDQIKKRVFVMLKGHNSLADGAQYAASTEQRKGCLFAEDHIILCGDGVLQIKGNYRHGLVTDGFLFVNPGATLVVTDAVKNAIHVKGSGVNNEYRGIEVTGGYVYANTSAPAGKAMKCDGAIRLRGGVLSLNCSGNAALDETTSTLGSAACIKSDASVSITGGKVSLCATGTGGKGINADAGVEIAGGELTVAVSGESVTRPDDTSTPKGINAHGSLAIGAGVVNVSAIGQGCQALASDVEMAVNGGVVYAFGCAYGVKALAAGVNGGTFICGGAENSPVAGVSVINCGAVTAEQVTPVGENEGGAEPAALFQWPVGLSAASLLFRVG